MTETTMPHTAVISVQLEVHSLLDTGECSGKVLSNDTLKKYDIQSAFVTMVNGHTMEACLDKLKNKIQELKE